MSWRSERETGDHSGGPKQDRYILHITSAASWRDQKRGSGGFRDPSLDAEGFIHCSTVEQFLIPANERFAGRNDLVLLVIDTERLDIGPVYEDCYDSGTTFPHLYGPIPAAAVVEVIDFPPEPDGLFVEPVGLSSFEPGPATVDRHVEGTW